MADLRIVDAPLLSTVKGTEKIPTGGEGNFSVSVNQVADFAKLKWFLATEGYVDNAVGNVQSDLNLHKNSVSNPHGVTKVQVGLGNVDNTADLDKPVSNATQSAIITANSGKADKSYVDSQDQLKADKNTVEASLLLKADKADLKASKIASDGGQNQQVINDFGGAKWYAKVGGYELGATIKLANGDTVQSTKPANIINPNADMTGWVNPKAEQQKVNSKIRKTPYDFGAKGGNNDDTQAVIDCINSGDDFEINDSHLVQPFEITDLHLNGRFTSKGKLRIESTSLVDLVVFRRCSGELHNLNVEAEYSAGSYATLVFDWCEDMSIHRPKIKNGKVIGLCVQNSTNTHVYNGKGEAEASQSWYLISCIDSTMSYCKLKNTGSGFYIIGAGYKSGTNIRSEIPEHDSIGMAFRYCFADVTNLGFDINGAVGAEFYKCIATQRWSDTKSSCFQVKQSTNIPEETKRLTQKNKVIGCLAMQCNRGFNTQNGEDVLFKDNYIFGSKHNGIGLNDTPRVTIDGLYCFDLFQQNVSSPAIDTGSRAGIVFAKNPSSQCTVRNVRLYQSVMPEDITKISLFEFDGEGCSLDDVRINTSGVVDSSPNKFANFCVNMGLHFNYGSNLKVGTPAKYNTLIDDQTSTAIYPLVFSKQIDLATAVTGTEYFDVPERGLIVGKVRFHVVGTPTNCKIGVGDQASIVRTLGLTDVKSGVSNYDPANQVIAQSLALAIRREITGTASGQLIVQMRGISLY